MDKNVRQSYPKDATASLDHAQIRSLLDKVLASESFAGTTRLTRLLTYLVEEALKPGTETISGYVIGLDVFDKPETFDPATDPIVRVMVGNLRRRLSRYISTEGAKDTLRIVIPKGRYKPDFQTALPPAPAHPSDATRKLAVSLAVLPFRTLAGTPGHDFLAEGFTDDVVNALCQFRELRVHAARPDPATQDNAMDLVALARSLGVGHLLSGTVRTAEARLRVATQLICGATGQILHTQSYDRDANAQNLLDIQDDVAARIATEIGEPHGILHKIGAPTRRHAQDTLEASEARLLATEYWRDPNEADHARVVQLLESAVAENPRHGGAWAMLAILYTDELRGDFNFRSDPPPLKRALEAADRAVELDPFNATGFLAQLIVHFCMGSFDSFEQAAKTALSLNPNYPDMLATLAFYRGFRNQEAQAEALWDRAFEISPNPPDWYAYARSFLAFQRGDYIGAYRGIEGLTGRFWRLEAVMELAALGHIGQSDNATALIAKIELDRPSVARAVLNNIKICHLGGDFILRLNHGLLKAGYNPARLAIGLIQYR